MLWSAGHFLLEAVVRQPCAPWRVRPHRLRLGKSKPWSGELSPRLVWTAGEDHASKPNQFHNRSFRERAEMQLEKLDFHRPIARNARFPAAQGSNCSIFRSTPVANGA